MANKNDDGNENLFIFTIISFHDLFVPRTKSTPLKKFPAKRNNFL